MTETIVPTMTSWDDVVVGSCGKPVPNVELKIVDLNSGEELGPGERGELCVRGPNVGIVEVDFISMH